MESKITEDKGKSKEIKITSSKEKSLLKKIQKTDEWKKVKDIKDLYDEIKDYDIDNEDIGLNCSRFLNNAGDKGKIDIDELYNTCYKLRAYQKKQKKEEKKAQKKGRAGKGGKATADPKPATSKKDDEAEADLKKIIKDTIKKHTKKGIIDPVGFLRDMGINGINALCSQGAEKGLVNLLTALQTNEKNITDDFIGWADGVWSMSGVIYNEIATVIAKCSIPLGVSLTAWLGANLWGVGGSGKQKRDGKKPPNTSFRGSGGDDDDDDDKPDKNVKTAPQPPKDATGRFTGTGRAGLTPQEQNTLDIQRQMGFLQQQQQQQILAQQRLATQTKLETDIKSTPAYMRKKGLTPEQSSSIEKMVKEGKIKNKELIPPDYSDEFFKTVKYSDEVKNKYREKRKQMLDEQQKRKDALNNMGITEEIENMPNKSDMELTALKSGGKKHTDTQTHQAIKNAVADPNLKKEDYGAMGDRLPASEDAGAKPVSEIERDFFSASGQRFTDTARPIEPRTYTPTDWASMFAGTVAGVGAMFGMDRFMGGGDGAGGHRLGGVPDASAYNPNPMSQPPLTPEQSSIVPQQGKSSFESEKDKLRDMFGGDKTEEEQQQKKDAEDQATKDAIQRSIDDMEYHGRVWGGIGAMMSPFDYTKAVATGTLLPPELGVLRNDPNQDVAYQTLQPENVIIDRDTSSPNIPELLREREGLGLGDEKSEQLQDLLQQQYPQLYQQPHLFPPQQESQYYLSPSRVSSMGELPPPEGIDPYGTYSEYIPEGELPVEATGQEEVLKSPIYPQGADAGVLHNLQGDILRDRLGRVRFKLTKEDGTVEYRWARKDSDLARLGGRRPAVADTPPQQDQEPAPMVAPADMVFENVIQNSLAPPNPEIAGIGVPPVLGAEEGEKSPEEIAGGELPISAMINLHIDQKGHRLPQHFLTTLGDLIGVGYKSPSKAGRPRKTEEAQQHRSDLTQRFVNDIILRLQEHGINTEPLTNTVRQIHEQIIANNERSRRNYHKDEKEKIANVIKRMFKK